ncbi:Bodo-specific multi-copy gene family, putative [Bodo saltans]|uniref:Bodo-specific multi-copy gene family, putative n=1 Tax=Bodo saltans TaxID=75058 RepID=A0A0S4JM06_BODSA|nr:Bodo-specific multi-copy gene family, putative [Bodo saltans]|eukprot:CUG92551.1 Bodo-specific multi-copy gene family, putative [Bodo saltans]
MKHQGVHAATQRGPCLTTLRSTCAAMSACRPSSAATFVGSRRRGEPNCVQWVCRQGLSSITRNMSSVKEFARVVKLFAAVSKKNDDAVLSIHTDAKYYDATTWPTHWGATEIELLLRGNIAHHDARPNYTSLATLLSIGDAESINVLLRVYVKPPPPKHLDVDAFIALHLGATKTESLNDTITPLSCQENNNKVFNVLNQALTPPAGSEKRNIACLVSPSGTLQMVNFLALKRLRATQCGRVIVRSCEKDKAQPWLTQLFEGHAVHSNRNALRAANSSDAALCGLIRSHVESVTGTSQDPSNYSDPKTAYDTWMVETAWHFQIEDETESMKPLIILDHCETLRFPSPTVQHKSFLENSFSKPFTLLEAFCLAIPAPHSILVAGCNAEFSTSNHLTLSVANVTNIGGPLAQSETRLRFSRDRTRAIIASHVDSNTANQRIGSVSALMRNLLSHGHDDVPMLQVLNLLRSDRLTPLVLPPKVHAPVVFPFFIHDVSVCCSLSISAAVLSHSWTFERPQRSRYFPPLLVPHSYREVEMFPTLRQYVRRDQPMFTLTLPCAQLFIMHTTAAMLSLQCTTRALRRYNHALGSRNEFETSSLASLLAIQCLRCMEAMLFPACDSTATTLDETTPSLVFHLHPQGLYAHILWCPRATRIKNPIVHEVGCVGATEGETTTRWLEVCLDNIGARLGKGMRGVDTLCVRGNIRILPLFDRCGSYERQIVRCNETVQVRPMSPNWLTSASTFNAMWLERVVEECGAAETLVRSCTRDAKFGSSRLDLAMADMALPALPVPETHPTDAGMCELIREHVKTVTGSLQDPTKYCDSRTASATWMSGTPRCFNIPANTKCVEPLIVLDSYEVPAQ